MRMAAKLLFQFRVIIDNSSGIYRKCEERYVVFDIVTDVYETLDRIYECAKNKNRSFKNCGGNKVYFEFVGISDYIIMGAECEENEFWYDFVVKKLPMENKKKLTMSKSEIKRKIKKKLANEDKPIISDERPKSFLNINADLSDVILEYYPEDSE